MIKLEYIKSSGTLYIDTGFIPNLNTRVVLDLVAEATSSTTSGYLCGARTSGSSNQFAILTRTNYYAARYGTLETTIYNGVVSNRLIIDMNKNVFTVNGTSITLTSETFECPVTFTLFDINNNGEIPYSPLNSIKLYSCKIYDNEVLVRDFIPMATDTGECGLWDNIEEKFYVSPNGNKFEGIREDNGMPVGYTLCEYIKSHGQEYIDTGFIPNQDTRVVMDALTEALAANGNCWFGVRSDSTTNSFNAFIIASGYWYGYASTYSQVSATKIYERLIYDANKNNFTVTDPDGITYNINHSYKSFTAPHSLILLALWATNETHGIYPDTYMTGKIYSCQIYDNGTLVRDYIPVVNKDGVYGLWDKVNLGFYTSPIGAFSGKWLNNYELKVTPAELRQRLFNKVFKRELPAGYYECEYIESNGTQYIDTGIANSSSDRITLNASLSYTTVTPTNLIMGFNGNASNGIGLARSSWWEMSSLTAAQVGTIYELEWDVNGTNVTRSVDGNSVSSTRSLTTFTGNLLLFAANTDLSTATVNYYCSCKFYKSLIYVNGVLVRDFIPCVNKEGIFGLYDKVNGVFYPSMTSSQFTGKVKNPSNYYNFVDSITLDGSALIDTNYKPNNNTKIIADFNIEAYSDLSALFGVCESGKSFLMFTGDNNVGFQVDMQSTSTTSMLSTYTTTGRLLFSMYASGSILTVKMGASTGTYGSTISSFQSTYNMYIGTINNNGTPMFEYPFLGEIYSFQIYENNVLVRDFVPATDPMGEVGLYDKINDTFHPANMMGLPTGYSYINGAFSNGSSNFGDASLYKADFTYTGSVQSVTLSPGTYKLQCWGALGGGIKGLYSSAVAVQGSKGGYSEGVLTLTSPKTLYIFVGGRGTNNTGYYTESTSLVNGGWNGGGAAVKYSSYDNGYSNPAPGGGSTDIALTTSSMSYSGGRTNRSTASLNSRFIVAGGGAGASFAVSASVTESDALQQGGGTSGCGQYPGTLSSGGNGNGNDGGFGYGGSQTVTNYSYCSGGAGSGWYGGGTVMSNSSTSYLKYTGGGSGFVNTSANASYRPSGYTGLQLDSGTTIAGNKSFPSISGGTETGHSGNGYARITQLS